MLACSIGIESPLSGFTKFEYVCSTAAIFLASPMIECPMFPTSALICVVEVMSDSPIGYTTIRFLCCGGSFESVEVNRIKFSCCGSKATTETLGNAIKTCMVQAPMLAPMSTNTA